MRTHENTHSCPLKYASSSCFSVRRKGQDVVQRNLHGAVVRRIVCTLHYSMPKQISRVCLLVIAPFFTDAI